MSDTFTYSVVTPDKTVAQGECSFLVVPTARGEMGIQAHHAALLVPVVPGELRITKADRVEKVRVGHGMLHVRDNSASLLIHGEA